MKKFWKIAGIVIASLVVVFLILVLAVYFSNRNGNKDWEARLDGAKATLQAAGPVAFPEIMYRAWDDPELMRTRIYFNLDSIAGEGDELVRMENIMMWVHNNIEYDGGQPYSGQRNAIDLYEYYKVTGNGINCRMMATVANEFYLAAKFKSKFVTCMSKDSTDNDAHVINEVWSRTLDKWVWMDSSFGVYVTDDNGVRLSIAEVREKLIQGEPMKVNEGKEKSSGVYRKDYLNRYMAKNLYWFGVESEYKYNTESAEDKPYNIALTPEGYTIWQQQAQWCPYVTHNADWYWKAPVELSAEPEVLVLREQ